MNDLTPLAGMPLRAMNLTNCKKLTDLSPLAGLSLTQIHLPPAPLKIDVLPPTQFWKLWDAAKTKGNSLDECGY